MRALTQIVPIDDDRRHMFTVSLTDPEPYVREAVVQALAVFVPTDTDILTALMARLDDEAEQVRLVAVRALAAAPELE